MTTKLPLLPATEALKLPDDVVETDSAEKPEDSLPEVTTQPAPLIHTTTAATTTTSKTTTSTTTTTATTATTTTTAKEDQKSNNTLMEMSVSPN